MSYVYRQCSTLGCTVMIGWTIGTVQGCTTCKWCQEGKAYYADGTLRKKS